MALKMMHPANYRHAYSGGVACLYCELETAVAVAWPKAQDSSLNFHRGRHRLRIAPQTAGMGILQPFKAMDLFNGHLFEPEFKEMRS